MHHNGHRCSDADYTDYTQGHQHTQRSVNGNWGVQCTITWSLTRWQPADLFVICWRIFSQLLGFNDVSVDQEYADSSALDMR